MWECPQGYILQKIGVSEFEKVFVSEKSTYEIFLDRECENLGKFFDFKITLERFFPKKRCENVWRIFGVENKTEDFSLKKKV